MRSKVLPIERSQLRWLWNMVMTPLKVLPGPPEGVLSEPNWVKALLWTDDEPAPQPEMEFLLISSIFSNHVLVRVSLKHLQKETSRSHPGQVP